MPKGTVDNKLVSEPKLKEYLTKKGWKLTPKELVTRLVDIDGATFRFTKKQIERIGALSEKYGAQATALAATIHEKTYTKEVLRSGHIPGTFNEEGMEIAGFSVSKKGLVVVPYINDVFGKQEKVYAAYRYNEKDPSKSYVVLSLTETAAKVWAAAKTEG